MQFFPKARYRKVKKKKGMEICRMQKRESKNGREIEKKMAENKN